MNRSAEKLSISELAERFVEIALAQDQALLLDDRKGFNRLFAEMTEIDNELRDRGAEARRALVALYTHPNFQVRLQAAERTLAVEPVAARKVIEAIRDSMLQPQALEAGMALWNLDRGVFKPT